MKRLLRMLGIVAAALLLAVIALSLWLRSEMALRYAVTELESRSGGAIKVGTAEGTLMGPFTLRDVELDTPGAHVHAASLSVDWGQFGLLAGAVDIHSLEIQGVDVRLMPSQKKPGPLFPLHPPVMPLLPVRIVLQAVRVQDVTLYTQDGAAPLHIDSADFAARVSNRSIALRQLKLRGPELEVQGEAGLAPRHGYAAHADLNWRWQPQNFAALSGRTVLDGDARRLDLRQTLAAPYALNLKATLTDAFTAPKWSGDLSVARISAAAIRPGTGAYAAGGSLRFQGGLTGTWIRGSVQADSPRLGPLDARVDVLLSEQRLEFRTLSVKLAQSGTALDLKGTVQLTAGAPATLSGSWRNAGLPAYPWLSSPEGTLRLDTDAQCLRLSLAGSLAPGGGFDAHLEMARAQPHAWTMGISTRDMELNPSLPLSWMDPLLPTGEWQLAAHGDSDTAHIDQLAGDWLDGRLNAQGLYTRSSGRWQTDLHLKDVDPELLSGNWPGKVDASLSAEGGGGEALDITLHSLQGTLRDNILKGTGHARIAGKSLKQLTADAALGDSRLHLDADLDAGEKLAWRLDSTDLSILWPDTAGVLHTQGELDTGMHHTLLQFTLDGQALSWHRDQLGTLHAEARVTGAADAHAHIIAGDISLPGIQITRLDAAADGGLARHALKLDLDSDDGTLALTGTGDYDGAAWHGAFDQVMLAPKGVGTWRAPSPWSLSIAPHAVALAAACLVKGDANACGRFDWDSAGWRAHADVDRLPLAALQPILPSGLSYSGALHAALDAGDDKTGMQLALDALLTPGSVKNLAQGKEVTLLAYSSGQAHLHVNPKLTSASVNWQLTDGGNLDLAAQVKRGKNPRLSGHIRGQFGDFQLLPAMIPQVSSASGRLALDVALSGTPDEPQFGGTATFDGGDVTVPRLGLHLHDVAFKLGGDGSHLTLTGKAASGDGSLIINAEGKRLAGVWYSSGNLDGQNFRGVDIPEAQVDVSPALSFVVDDHDVHVTGSVGIPHARLQPRDLTTTAQVSTDQVIVGEEGGPPQEKWHVYAAVSAVMGDDVNFDGFGLSGKIGGAVLAVDQPGHITVGDGTLTIQNGLYASYGQKLRIDNGKLLFTGGPISNPGLDILALRAAAHPEMLQPGAVEQKVGVIVRGTLRAPRVMLYSDPPLTQAQATNYLLFGTAGFETSANAVGGGPSTTQDNIPNFSMQLGGGNGTFDVSKQNVQTASGTQTASLFVGRYLSPRLYVSYGVGLYDPITVKRLIYKLSEKWTLQAESGAANSADIIYTLEH